MASINGNRGRRDLVQAVLALALFFAAGVACVQSGDQAPTSGSSSSPTNAAFTGTVTLPGGIVASGASVTVDRGDYGTTTNASGAYSLPIAGGNLYNIAVSYPGYRTVVVRGVRVTANQTISQNIQLTTPLAAGETTYVGSVACKQCHATAHARWANSAHRYGLGAPGDSPGILAAVETLFTSGYNLVNTSSSTAFGSYGTNAPRLSKSGDTYYITIGNVAHPVIYAMGYQWKQRYITRIGQAHYVLPIQYNVATSEWVTYNPGDWYNTTTYVPHFNASASLETDVNKRNSWERKCMGCHSVTGILSLEFSNSPTTGIAQHRAEWVERGVGCEACHGPGSRHVWSSGSTGSIINPAKLPRDRAMDVCGQCHSRGFSVAKINGLADSFVTSASADTWTLEYFYLNGRTFRPGDVLNDGYSDGGGYWSDATSEVRTSKQHHQQWNDMYQSAHLAPGAAISNITCASCHEVHGPVGFARQMKLSSADNSICLTCHGPSGSAAQRFANDTAVIQHTGDSHVTYSPGTTGKGRCITCHMPATARTAVAWDIRSHTFRVIRPHNTFRMSNSDSIPNSCQQSCHNGTSGMGNAFTDSRLAALAWDSSVERPQLVMPDSGYARVSGRIAVQNARSFADTFGVWVSADHTGRGTVTNRDGSWALVLDAPGTYTIRAMKAGYASVVYDTVNVLPGVNQALSETALPESSAARFAAKPYRCMACHGAIWGSEWRKSGYAGARLSEADDATDLAAGHGLMAASPAGRSGCNSCHEARSATMLLQAANDSTAVYPTTVNMVIGAASRRSQTCEVCHRPHDSAADTTKQLRVYREVQFDTNYFYSASSGAAYGSMIMPAPYKAAGCIMCHQGRTGPRSNGGGLSNRANTLSTMSNGSSLTESGTASNPHVGNNAEGYFGIYQGTTMASINFDTITGFVPRNSYHSDSWGKTFEYQAFIYSGGAPRLVSRNGVPVRRNERFTCLTCHMYSQELGTASNGTASVHDGGHSWKPDVRACAVCHDPVYMALNPYTNPLKSSTGDATWGSGSWGVNSAGRVLGFNRPVSELERSHSNDSGGSTAATVATRTGDGVKNDYDGNGIAEGAHTEAANLFKRVVAAMEYGTHGGKTSGINGSQGLGDTLLISATTGKPGNPYWIFNRTRSLATNGTAIANADTPLTRLTNDELRIAYNLVLFDHDETNLGVHNLRFAVETLRTMWTILGRTITGNTTWVPPGDDY